jgi:glycerol-3-phosphate dehydrogenase
VDDDSSRASAVTRDYRLDLDRNGAPMLSVFGGKITTFRKLAEEAVDLLAPTLSNHRTGWTADACLPGGDLFGSVPSNRSVLEFDNFRDVLQKQYAWLPPALVARFARAYGSRTHKLLDGRNAIADMGMEIQPGLFAAEVEYLMRTEWASCAADILWRRSKLGLHLPTGAAQEIDDWISRNMENNAAGAQYDAGKPARLYRVQ